MRPLHIFILSLVTLLAASSLHAGENIADVLTDRSLQLSRAADRATMVARIAAIENRRQAAAHQKARRLGLPIRMESGGNIAELVDFIGDEPLYITTMNADAAVSTGANLLLALPYELDGAGITVGVWDAGTGNPAHQEFILPGGGSRLSQMDSTYIDAHSAHVAGTIAAAGVDPAARGMAPAARVDAYSRSGDLSEMTSRAATAADQLATHIYLSNHSYGPFAGWNGSTWYGDGQDSNAAEYRFGRYENISRNQDALAYAAPYYLIFRSAGNERDDNPKPGTSVTLAAVGGEVVAYDPLLHPPGDGVYRNGYETIAPDTTAKNIMTVGAVEDAVTDGFHDVTKADLTSFTSTGPTDDGRIKPDLVANGASLYSTLHGTTDYTMMSGTSMSSPSACGSAALLMQLYDRLFGGAMRASTLKGLMLHTADDLGNPGPDYQFGWGLANVRRAADHLIYHDSFPERMRFTEDELTSSLPSKSYSFEWDGVSPLRATLSWTDPAGVAVDIHDSRVPTLVNDLNLKLIAPNGSEYFPYVMPFVGTWTTESMSLPATTGVNHTDNVEQVRIETGAPAGIWQAEVTYSGPLTDGLQAYGLLISEDVDPLNIDSTPPNTDPVTWERAPAAGAGPILLPVAGTDFTERTVSRATASNIAWTTTGASDPGNLKTTANYDLFDTADAQGHFAPKRNVDNQGPWSISVPLNLTDSELLLTEVVLDYQHFNASGNYQTAERTVNWTVTVSGSTSGELDSVLVNGLLSFSGIATATFDPPLTLSTGQSYSVSITAQGVTGGNNTGLDALAVNGYFGIAGDPQTEISMVASTATDLAGVEYYFAETSGKVGGDDSGWQDSPSYTDTGLLPGITYSYTVIARDKSPFHNTTSVSASGSATTQGEPPAYYAWSGGMPFEADRNADGVADGLAWFLGAADPQAGANSLLPTVDNASDPDFFIFKYRPDAAAQAAGAEAKVYYSSDLVDWTPAVHDGINVILDVSGDTTNVRFAHGLAEDGKLFVYLQVKIPEAP